MGRDGNTRPGRQPARSRMIEAHLARSEWLSIGRKVFMPGPQDSGTVYVVELLQYLSDRSIQDVNDLLRCLADAIHSYEIVCAVSVITKDDKACAHFPRWRLRPIGVLHFEPDVARLSRQPSREPRTVEVEPKIAVRDSHMPRRLRSELVKFRVDVEQCVREARQLGVGAISE